MGRILSVVFATWVVYAFLVVAFQEQILEGTKKSFTAGQHEYVTRELTQRSPNLTVGQVNAFAVASSACATRLHFTGVKSSHMAMLFITFGYLKDEIYQPVNQEQLNECIEEGRRASGL